MGNLWRFAHIEDVHKDGMAERAKERASRNT